MEEAAWGASDDSPPDDDVREGVDELEYYGHGSDSARWHSGFDAEDLLRSSGSSAGGFDAIMEEEEGDVEDEEAEDPGVPPPPLPRILPRLVLTLPAEEPARVQLDNVAEDELERGLFPITEGSERNLSSARTNSQRSSLSHVSKVSDDDWL